MARSPRQSQAKPIAKPVPPDAVRVWRGFRLGTLTPEEFLQDLSTIFIPVTAQLQRLYGLTAYLPTVLPSSKPAGVPDEIALVFYQTQQAYNDTSNIVAGRAYSLLHKTVFAFPASLSGFPALLGSALALDQPYFLFAEAVDWRGGFTQVFVGSRPENATVQQFTGKLQRFFQREQKLQTRGLDGAIFCVSANYVVYWEHWTSEAASLHGRISELPKHSTRILLQPYAAQPVEASLTAPYPGLSGVESKSFNIIFPR